MGCAGVWIDLNCKSRVLSSIYCFGISLLKDVMMSWLILLLDFLQLEGLKGDVFFPISIVAFWISCCQKCQILGPGACTVQFGIFNRSLCRCGCGLPDTPAVRVFKSNSSFFFSAAGLFGIKFCFPFLLPMQQNNEKRFHDTLPGSWR